MKNLLLVFIFCLSRGITNAQKLTIQEVPTAVKSSFTKSFPKATNINWSKEGTNEYEAEFRINKISMASNFDKEGKWLVTETEIKIAELPKTVQSAIATRFPGYKIEEAEKAETAGKEIFYEVKLEKGESNLEVQFSSEGKILKKEEKKETDKND